MRETNTTPYPEDATTAGVLGRDKPGKVLIVALICVYIFWGSTYLFIHFMIETMPPLLMSGLRNVIAGGILYLFARFRGGSAPTAVHWRSAFLLGFLLLTIANGGMAIAVRTVPTGIAALMVATLPVFLVVFNWIAFARSRPSLYVIMGLILGLAGLGLLLFGQGKLSATTDLHLNWVNVGIIMLGVFTWALATLLAPRIVRHPSQLQSTAMQMFAGGIMLLIISIVYEQPSWNVWEKMTPMSTFALIYLIVFGSWIGFTAYAWLAQNAPPHVTSTYAYVNPVVAMFLGWAFANESLTLLSLLAATIIIAGVILITFKKKLPIKEVVPSVAGTADKE